MYHDEPGFFAGVLDAGGAICKVALAATIGVLIGQAIGTLLVHPVGQAAAVLAVVGIAVAAYRARRRRRREGRTRTDP